MIKDLVSSLDYSTCAELALAVFVVAFFAILFAAFRLSASATDRFANIPLSDQIEDPRDD